MWLSLFFKEGTHDLAFQSVGCGLAAPTAPGQLLEMYNLRPFLRPTKSLSAFSRKLWVVLTHVNIWEALVYSFDEIHKGAVIPPNSEELGL